MDFVAGMTWGWPGRRGTWTTPEAERSMQLMKDRLGVTWTTLAFAALQDNAQSTEIHWRDAPTVDEAEVRAGVERAHALGLQVCLKPMVNCADGTWRAHINFFDVDVPGEPTWGEWFASYTEYLVHYARVAQQTGCELFCIGCEMVQSDRRESEWRALIAEVRAVYSGAITYNCDKYQEDRLTWWDAVDVISSSGYYPEGSWPAQLDRIERVVTAHGQPFVFLEGGCPSQEGGADPAAAGRLGDVHAELQHTGVHAPTAHPAAGGPAAHLAGVGDPPMLAGVRGDPVGPRRNRGLEGRVPGGDPLRVDPGDGRPVLRGHRPHHHVAHSYSSPLPTPNAPQATGSFPLGAT